MGPDPGLSKKAGVPTAQWTHAYLILSTKKPKVECCTTVERPFPSPDPNSHSPFLTREVQPEFSRFCQADQQPEDRESGQRPKSLRPHPAQSQGPPPLTQPPSVALGTLSPPTAAAAVEPQREPARAGRGGRRFLDFLRELCLRPSNKWHRKRSWGESVQMVGSQGRAINKDSREVKPGSLHFKC